MQNHLQLIFQQQIVHYITLFNYKQMVIYYIT